MNLGEPKFIAIKINDGAMRKQISLFTNKFPLLRDDFFQLGSSNPSEHYIVFHLRGNISPETIANIYEVREREREREMQRIYSNVFIIVHSDWTI